MAGVNEKVFKILLPKLGESIVQATVVQWLKKEGDSVIKDEPLLEVMTDKVNSEIPSPCSGWVAVIHVKKDQEVEVGELLCTIKSTQEVVRYSPAVKRLAEEQGMTAADLAIIRGSGEEQRVTKKDVESYLSQKSTAVSLSSSLDPLRKRIAKEMVLSQDIPKAVLIDEFDVTSLVQYVDAMKQGFYEKEGERITITSFFAKALANALVSLPLLNASLKDEQIILHEDVHLGFAVSVEEGVLVPVISSCQNKTLETIAVEIARISREIKLGSWRGEQRHKGTVTLTNFGMGKVSIGIPMIIPGQTAIVGIGAMRQRWLVGENNTPVIGKILHLSLAFDHRVVDGMYACRLFAHIRRELEDLERKLCVAHFD